jgi:hypothetical protein
MKDDTQQLIAASSVTFEAAAFNDRDEAIRILMISDTAHERHCKRHAFHLTRSSLNEGTGCRGAWAGKDQKSTHFFEKSNVSQ